MECQQGLIHVATGDVIPFEKARGWHVQKLGSMVAAWKVTWRTIPDSKCLVTPIYKLLREQPQV